MKGLYDRVERFKKGGQVVVVVLLSSLQPQTPTRINADEEVDQPIWDNRRHVSDEVTF
jgi:hypothetical protein